jgi:tetratricopeptide (TPR) repeat protein
MNEQQIIGLINSHLMRGDLSMQAGDIGAAKDAYQRAKDLSPRLSFWFAVACDKLGDVARFSEQFSTAHEEYDQALPVFRKLAATKNKHRRDVSLCLSKIGELALAEDNIASARLALEEHYSIAEETAASDPSHYEYQRDLAGAHNRLQQMEVMGGNLTCALRHAEAAHAIIQRLVDIDSTNASCVQDLAGSDFVFAMLLLESGDKARAVGMLKNSLRTLKELAQKDKLDAKGKQLLAHLNGQFLVG